MHIFKRITLIITTVIVILILAIIILLLTIDPNRYKSRIEAFAENRANISLQMNGDLSWNLFPQFGISIKNTQISAINDNQNPVASVDELILSLKLFPLIKGDIDIKELHVDGLQLNILTHLDGSKNIDSFFTAPPNSQPQNPNEDITNNTASADSTTSNTITSNSPKISTKQRELTIDSMRFTNSQFNLENQLTKQQLKGNHLDFSIQNITLNAPNFSIDSLNFNGGNLYFSDTASKQEFDYQNIFFELKELTLNRTFIDPSKKDQEENPRIFTTSLQRFNLKKGEIKFVKDDQMLLLKPQSILVQDLRYSNNQQDPWQIGKIHILDSLITSQKSAKTPVFIIDKINLTAENLSPLSKGSLQFQLLVSQEDHLDFSLSGRSTLLFQQDSKTWNFKESQLKATINRLQNIHPNKASSLQLESDIELNLTQDSLLLSPFIILIDEQKMTGKIALTSLEKQQGTIALKGELLDLTPYLPDKQKSSINNGEEKQITKIENNTSTKNRNLTIHAELQKFKLGKLTAQDVGINALLQNDLITISNVKANILGGNIIAKGTVKTLSSNPIINGDVNITGLPLKNLLDMLQKQLPITGYLNLNGQLQTQGLDQASIMKHLQGNVQLNVSNGQLIGMDYEQLVCEGFALLKKESFRKNHTTPTTSFNKLSANATLRNGVISNNNLQIEIPGLAGSGNGTINLNNKTLDYRISLLLKESTGIPHCQIDQYLKNVTIPLRCQGSYINAGANLCGIDQNAIGKIIADLAKGKIESAIKENIQEILPPVLQPKKQENRQAPKPKDVIKAFEGLFNR